MMPPMLMKIAIYEEGVRKMNFWIPLVLIYLLLLPLFVFLLPFLIVLGVIAWGFGVGNNPFSWMVWIYELWCATKGTIIETKSKNERVYIRIF